jgi:hypothetical protein
LKHSQTFSKPILNLWICSKKGRGTGNGSQEPLEWGFWI